MSFVCRWSKDIDDYIEQSLPDEAKVAFVMRCELLEARPWGNGPPRWEVPTVTSFGEGMEGLLEYRVAEDGDGPGKHIIWITRVHW